MIWSAHSEGVLQRSPCTITPIAKAEKFNHLNPIAAILNMANICVCISIKLGGRWNLIMTWPGITISHNILSLHSTTTHCWYYFTPLQHTVDITSHKHNTLLILLHTTTTQYHFPQSLADAREDKCKKISAQLSKYNFYFLQDMMQWLYWCWILVKLTNSSVW